MKYKGRYQVNGESQIFRGLGDSFDNNLVVWVKITPDLPAIDPRGPGPEASHLADAQVQTLEVQTAQGQTQSPVLLNAQVQTQESPPYQISVIRTHMGEGNQILDKCIQCEGRWKRCNLEAQNWDRLQSRELLKGGDG